MKTDKKTVLVVDDDIDYLEQLNFHLTKMGYNVVKATGQKEAEKILATAGHDIAIFDLMMENQDSGFILSYKMKQINPDIPVIIATAVTAETGLVFDIKNDDDKKWIKADLYLAKGIRPDQLQREISKLLKI